MALDPEIQKLVAKSKAKYKGGGGDTVKPKDGRNRYRILAPKSSEANWVAEAGGQFWADLGVHWIKPTLDGKPIAVIGDSEAVYGEHSPVATAINMAIDNAMDDEAKELYKSFKSRKSVLVNAIERATGDIVVLELTPTTWGAFMDLMLMYSEEDQDICDPQDGLDIVINREGKGLNTKYGVAVAPGKSEPVTDEQMGKVTDLPDFIASKYFRGEEQKALSAIQQIAGISVPQLGKSAGGGAASTAALTSSGASVDDADTSDSEDTVSETKQDEDQKSPDDGVGDTGGLDEDDEAALLAELDNIGS